MNRKDDLGRSAGSYALAITFAGGDLNRKPDKLAWRAEQKGINVQLTAHDLPGDATTANPFTDDILCEFPDAASMERFKGEVIDVV